MKTKNYALFTANPVKHVKFSGFNFGHAYCKIKQLVFTGLATTKTLQSGLATSFNIFPWNLKIAPFISNKSILSMPGFRGKPPINIAISASLNIILGSCPTWTSFKFLNPHSSNSCFIPYNSSTHYSRSYNLNEIETSSPNIYPEHNKGSV